MLRYFIRRLLQGIPTLFGVTLISFFLIITAPGDPVQLLTWSPDQNPETIATLRRQLGLDNPPATQYLYWLIGNDWALLDSDGDGEPDSYGPRRGILRGDLGQSIKQQRPVIDLLLERIPNTLRLTISALIVGYGLGILLGTLAALNHRRILDQIIRILSVLGNALPEFWLGIILIVIFSINLGWLPLGGMRNVSTRAENITLAETLTHMILPVSVLALSTIANVSRFMRTQILEVLSQDYIRTAHSKGLSRRMVIWRHAARNALIPVVTLLGASLGTLLSGTVIVEQVFSWPGVGRLVIDSVFQRDYPIIMGAVVFVSALFIVGTIFSDMLYGLLDPRIRFSTQR